MQVERIPEQPVDWLTIGLNLCRCLFALAVALAVSQALREGVRLLDDMKSAMEVERPIRTRSDLEELPLVGTVFSMVCDVQDFVWFNTQLVSKYAGTIPFLFAMPTAVGTMSSLWSAKRAMTTAMAALSSMLMHHVS